MLRVATRRAVLMVLRGLGGLRRDVWRVVHVDCGACICGTTRRVEKLIFRPKVRLPGAEGWLSVLSVLEVLSTTRTARGARFRARAMATICGGGRGGRGLQCRGIGGGEREKAPRRSVAVHLWQADPQWKIEISQRERLEKGLDAEPVNEYTL